MFTVVRSPQDGREPARVRGASAYGRRTPLVLAGRCPGWSESAWGTIAERRDDEAEQAEHSDRVRPRRVGEGEQPDSGDKAGDRGLGAERGLESPSASTAYDVLATPESAPVSWRRNSSPSEGKRIAPPASTATTTHTSVSWPAAALSTVRRGRIVGQRASAQPAMIAATATAAA